MYSSEWHVWIGDISKRHPHGKENAVGVHWVIQYLKTKRTEIYTQIKKVIAGIDAIICVWVTREFQESVGEVVGIVKRAQESRVVRMASEVLL